MLTHESKKRVRYGETDQMGYLYYGNYALYYEIGRTEMLRSLGYSYREMEQEVGVGMPVVSMKQRFIRPGRYDELLTIRTTLRKLPDQFITFDVEIFNEARKLVNSGQVRLCFFAPKSQQTVPAPEILLAKLRPHFETD